VLPILIKYWKPLALLLAVLLLSGLILQVRVLQDKLALAKSDNYNLIQLNSDAQKQVATYTNKLGQEVARNNTLQISQKALQDLMKSQEHQWLENFKNLKKSLKNLEMAQQVSAEVSDSILVLLKYDSGSYINANGDTIKILFTKFSYQDQYTKIRATQVAPDSATVVYNVTVPLQQVIYWDRKWFLGKKHFNTEVTSPNKNVAITKLETIFVKKKKS
jgi:hypothetical protein